MGSIELFPNLPPAAATHVAAKLLNKHSPHEIAEAIEVLIEVLDMLGGDPDAEDATNAEDDFSLSPTALRFAKERGPGCLVTDSDEAAYVEWNTLPGRRKGGPCETCGHEDEEEDDPSGQCDEDGINTDLTVMRRAGPGCIISDSDYEDSAL